MVTVEAFEALRSAMPFDERWELIGGRVVKSAVGESWEHNVITQNVACGLRRRLETGPAQAHVFRETFYMAARTIESATLPDAMVTFGTLAAAATSVDDPILLVEVVSRASAVRDRRDKWDIYCRLPMLQHYVLVMQDRAAVEVFDRAGDTWAHARRLEGLDAVLDLPALGLSLPLSEIYDDVLTP